MKQTVTQKNSSSHQPLWIRKSKLSKRPELSPGFLRRKMQSMKSKGRIGTEWSCPVQTWTQCTTATCTDRHTQTSSCMCKELRSTALCDLSRSRLFPIKFLGNPHQGASIRSHFINALQLWEAREKPSLKEFPLAGLSGRIPHGSLSTGSWMLQILTVKPGAMGWAGEMLTSCCWATHTFQESLLELLLHLASMQSPHQGRILRAGLIFPALQELHFCLENQHGHGRAAYAPLEQEDLQNQPCPRWDKDV